MHHSTKIEISDIINMLKMISFDVHVFRVTLFPQRERDSVKQVINVNLCKNDNNSTPETAEKKAFNFS
jgi:hypothetical protein